jgi:hypothetical protein
LPHQPVHWCEPDGRLIKTFSGDVQQKATNGSEPTLRSELHDLLYRSVEDLVPVRFGLHPEALEPSGAGVRVTLSNGRLGTSTS